MSRLRIFNDNDPSSVLLETTDGATIASELARIGVQFERWVAQHPVAPGASQEEVFTALPAELKKP